MVQLDWFKALFKFIGEITRPDDSEDGKERFQRNLMKYSTLGLTVGIVVGLAVGTATKTDISVDVVSRNDEYEQTIESPDVNTDDPPDNDRDSEAYERLRRLYELEEKKKNGNG